MGMSCFFLFFPKKQVILSFMNYNITCFLGKKTFMNYNITCFLGTKTFMNYNITCFLGTKTFMKFHEMALLDIFLT